MGAWCQGGAGYEEELEIVLCGRCHCDSDPTPPRAGDPRRAMQWQRLLRHVCRPNQMGALLLGWLLETIRFGCLTLLLYLTQNIE